MDDNEYKRLESNIQKKQKELDNLKQQLNNLESPNQQDIINKMQEELSTLKHRVDDLELPWELMAENDDKSNLTTPEKENIELEEDKDSKFAMGFVFALFFGLIGLFFISLYKDEYERSTFVRGWVCAFIISLIISLIVIVIITTSISNSPRYY